MSAPSEANPAKYLLFDGTISWQDTSNNEDGFRVYSFDNHHTDATDILKGTVAANVTSFNFSASIVWNEYNNKSRSLQQCWIIHTRIAFLYGQ